ncbi:MAG: FAD-binding oxidoreductase [Acidobacteriota bacterium]|nr:MAG: FAD-binding oxidoreductase [Acidobacteriota bacterium]
MKRNFDVIVIGAGIIGLSIAYYLRKKARPSVLVLEKESSWITGSSARANGGFRQQFSTPINIRMSQLSLPVFESFEEEFRTDISFRQYGYLFVTASDSGERALKESLEFQQRRGVPVERVGPEEIARIAPYVRCDDLRCGNFCAKDGYADSYSIAAGFGARALEMGVQLRCETEVTGLQIGADRIVGVHTSSGIYSSGVVINAAGPFAGRIGEMAGIEVPVEPVRRMLVLTEPFAGIQECCPMTIDSDTGFFMRHESGRVLMGWSDPLEPAGFNLTFDPDIIDVVAEKAFHRVPLLEQAEVNPRKSWAGLYEVTPDHHCILGETEVRGLFLANGFSGHGMMHSPATGMILADLVLDGQTDLADITPVRPGRFREGDLIHESIVF